MGEDRNREIGKACSSRDTTGAPSFLHFLVGGCRVAFHDTWLGRDDCPFCVDSLVAQQLDFVSSLCMLYLPPYLSSLPLPGFHGGRYKRTAVAKCAFSNQNQQSCHVRLPHFYFFALSSIHILLYFITWPLFTYFEV